MALKALVVASLLSAPAAALAQAPTVSPLGREPLPDPAQEARAAALMRELRCLTCQNQSIAESDAPQAEAMRAVVRERIRAGAAPEEVRAELIDRYGDWVTFRPPARPDTWALWAMPVVALLVGALVARRLFR
ncbi:cytochrome c-type biogenesis protein [Thermaurantiacus sp.]